MGTGIISFVIVLAVSQRKFCDAIPTVTLTGESMFYDGNDLHLVCAVDQDVDLLSVSFFKGVTETIWINNPTNCTFHKLIPEDTSSYNTTCNSLKTNFTLIKYRLSISDDNNVWSCQMKSKPGGSGACVGISNPCKSGSITLSFQTTTSALDKNKRQCEVESGASPGAGCGIQIVILIIVVVIFICTDYKHGYTLGLVLGISEVITFHVSWIIFVCLISTGNECKLQLGLGLCLSTGIICLIICIIAVIFIFFSFSCFEDIPIKTLAKGTLIGLAIASVIVYIVYKIYEKFNGEPTCIAHKDNPQETDDDKLKRKQTCKNPEQELLEHTGKNPEQEPLEDTDKKSKTKNSGSSSDVSRKHVQVEMETKGVKSDEERTSAVHTRTQNKAEPKLNQTNDRQLPVPTANTGFEEIEETPTFRQLPKPPQNGETKDRNQRGISATINDTSDLASETPRPIKLPPLTPKQTTVQEEDALEKPKKKRKTKKKKDQMNVETPEEENSETI